MLISARIVVGFVIGSLIVNNIVNAKPKGIFFTTKERSKVTGMLLG